MYNPDKSEERSALPEDTIFESVITHIEDGAIKDFVRGDITKWKEPDSPAINVHIEAAHNGKQYPFSALFPYTNDGDKTVYGERSKLGKFAKKYGSLPKVGLKVKSMTNNDGFLRLKTE